HCQDDDLVAVLLLDLLNHAGERGAVRARGLHEFEEHDLAAVVVKVVKLGLGVRQGESRGAAWAVGCEQGRYRESGNEDFTHFSTNYHGGHWVTEQSQFLGGLSTSTTDFGPRMNTDETQIGGAKVIYQTNPFLGVKSFGCNELPPEKR